MKYIREHPNRSSFANDPRNLLAAIDEFSAQQDFLISIGPDKRNKIESIIVQKKPRTLVELGGYVGYSAIAFADMIRRGAGLTSFKVWSLEFDPRFAAIAEELIAMVDLSQFITVVVGAAGDSLRAMKADGRVESVDFLFIDHSEGGIELYETDLKVAQELQLLKSGALVVADNVLRPGAPKYREYVRSSSAFESRAVECLIIPGEFGDELEVSRLK